MVNLMAQKEDADMKDISRLSDRTLLNRFERACGWPAYRMPRAEVRKLKRELLRRLGSKKNASGTRNGMTPLPPDSFDAANADSIR